LQWRQSSTMAPNLNFNLWLPDDHPEMSSHFSNGWALPGDQTVRVSGAGWMPVWKSNFRRPTALSPELHLLDGVTQLTD
jgi:hypothetical protein